MRKTRRQSAPTARWLAYRRDAFDVGPSWFLLRRRHQAATGRTRTPPVIGIILHVKPVTLVRQDVGDQPVSCREVEPAR